MNRKDISKPSKFNLSEQLSKIKEKLSDNETFLEGVKALDAILCNTESLYKKLFDSAQFKQDLHDLNEMIIEKMTNALFAEAYKAYTTLDFNKQDTINTVIDVQNTHSNYIKNTILSSDSFQKRNLILQRWIAIAYKAHLQGDFFTAKNVFYKLTCDPQIARLWLDQNKDNKVIKNYFSNDSITKYLELCSFYNKTPESANKLNQYKNIHKPKIDYIAPIINALETKKDEIADLKKRLSKFETNTSKTKIEEEEETSNLQNQLIEFQQYDANKNLLTIYTPGLILGETAKFLNDEKYIESRQFAVNDKLIYPAKLKVSMTNDVFSSMSLKDAGGTIPKGFNSSCTVTLIASNNQQVTTANPELTQLYTSLSERLILTNNAGIVENDDLINEKIAAIDKKINSILSMAANVNNNSLVSNVNNYRSAQDNYLQSLRIDREKVETFDYQFKLSIELQKENKQNKLINKIFNEKYKNTLEKEVNLTQTATNTTATINSNSSMIEGSYKRKTTRPPKSPRPPYIKPSQPRASSPRTNNSLFSSPQLNPLNTNYSSTQTLEKEKTKNEKTQTHQTTTLMESESSQSSAERSTSKEKSKSPTLTSPIRKKY